MVICHWQSPWPAGEGRGGCSAGEGDGRKRRARLPSFLAESWGYSAFQYIMAAQAPKKFHRPRSGISSCLGPSGLGSEAQNRAQSGSAVVFYPGRRHRRRYEEGPRFKVGSLPHLLRLSCDGHWHSLGSEAARCCFFRLPGPTVNRPGASSMMVIMVVEHSHRGRRAVGGRGAMCC